MTRRGLRGAATIIMVAATAACSPGLVQAAHTTGTSPAVSSSNTTPSSATPTSEGASSPATLTPRLAAPPPGTQWAANSIVHLRFAVPDTWTVLDPTKLHSADFVNIPSMRQMAARLGVSPEEMAAQVSRARIFTVSSSRPPADIVLTDLPVTGMLTDASIVQQFATLTGSTKNIHLSRGESPGVGHVTQVSLVVPMAGRAPLQSEAGIFSTSDAVFIVFVTATDRATVDRLYNQAMNTMALY